MEKAQAAVKSFTSHGGHHETTVHESVSPQVQKETVNQHQREERQVARDREVHQDHHHTTVQPIQDQEVLAEQHHHKAHGVEHVTHDHRDHSGTKDRLEREKAQFQNESVRAPVQHQEATVNPEVVGEHVHHHVHENIQPVVHKQTIEPHVVHTTVPIHETHHNKAEHHTSTALPAVSMADYQKQGGSLSGHEAKHSHFEGEPHSLGKTIGNATPTTSVTGDRLGDHADGVGHSSTHHTGGLPQDTTRHAPGTSGSTGYESRLDPRVNDPATRHATGTSGMTGHDSSRMDPRVNDHTTAASGAAGHEPSRLATNTNDPAHNNIRHTSSHGSGGTTTHKPSLLDRINPMKDSDGDGKKGFMK